MATEANTGAGGKLPFPAYWALTDGRRNFFLEPKRNASDGDLFFGGTKLSDEIKSRVTSAFILDRPPKLYLEGSWGAGKTHSLYHIKRYLETAPSPDGIETIPIYVDLDVYKATHYRDLHASMLEGISRDKVKRLTELFLAKNAGNLEQAEAKTIGNEHTSSALRAITIGGGGLAGWKYLLGDKLTNAELTALNNVGAIEGVNGLVDILNVIGELAHLNNERFLFLVDECETLRLVTDQDSRTSFTNAMLRLTESPTIGFIMTYINAGNEPIPDFMATNPIIQRMGGAASRIYIDNLAENAEDRNVRDFLRELLVFMTDPDKVAKRVSDEGLRDSETSYPFTESSLELFISNCLELNNGAVPPRLMIEYLNQCAVDSYQRSNAIIDDEVVENRRAVVMPPV